MTHPLAVHFVPDSGHAAELVRMGAVAFHYDPLFVTAVSELFVQHGLEGHGSPLRPEKVSFFGNLYFAATEQSPYRDRADLLKLRQAALVRCEADWDLAPYQAYRTAIADMPADIRASLKLDPDQSFHWRFLYDELSIVANGEHRFRLLDTCKLPIAFYGGFADPSSRATIADRAWLLRESLPYGRPLAEAYRSTSITLDVVNAPFINGFSPKLLECYAAGGFLLTTRKRDIATAFGGLADAIGYSSADELTAKIDYYLTHDSERRSVTRDMQEIIRHNYTASALFARTLPVAVESLRARRT